MPGDLEYRSLLPARLRAEDGRAGGTELPRSARDWFVDTTAVLFAVIVGIGLWLYEADRQGALAGTWLAADFVVGMAACLALWGRRRWPVALAVAMIPLGAVSPTSGGAGIVAVFTVAVHRPLRVLLPIAVANVVTVPVYFWLYPSPDLPFWAMVTFGVLLILVVVAWGMFVRARRQLVLSLAERTRRVLAEHELRVDQARHNERTRIAREMHDVLGHRLSLLSMQAGALEFRPDAAPPEVVEAAGVIRATAREALEDLRAVIGVLRADGAAAPETAPAPEPPQPTLDDLDDLIAECRRSGTRIRLARRLPDGATVPPALGRSAYRIVQEGLTNARKHAPDTAVDVAVHGATGDGLTVEVRNPLPVGASSRPTLPGANAGLVGLRERVNLAGGRLEHGWHDGHEFRLRAWLPWPA